MKKLKKNNNFRVTKLKPPRMTRQATFILIAQKTHWCQASRLLKMKTFRLTWISGKPRCTGFWAWGENHGRAVELYRESIEATQVARCPDYLDYVALMTLTIKWRRRLKTTVEYKTTSTGPRYHLPILEMLHVLFWDDRQLGVLSIWRNISTGDMQTCLSQFSTWFSHLQIAL